MPAASRFFLLLIMQALPSVALAQPSAKLGELTFPNSGQPKVQEAFLTGLKLLHNFEYEEARTTFQQIQQKDPGFAMGYWGEAMCLNHPLWGEQELEAARAILQRMDAIPLRPSTALEQGFLQALRILYGDGPKEKRDLAYAQTLADHARAFPKEHEVRCFHALAILGTCGGNRKVNVYMKAAGILEDVYRENPDHPGVLHYLIHCYDDPTHAPLGLRAARTYGTVADNSAHAKHMPSHIYLPLGMWREVVTSNQEAWEAGKQRLERLKLQPGDYDIHALHALQWLQYGYLQTGDYGRALELLKVARKIHEQKPSAMCKWYFALMQSSYLIEAPEGQDADWELELEQVELSAVASYYFAGGLIAVRKGTTGAERSLQRIRTLRQAAELHIDQSSRHHSSYFDGVYASSIRTARIVETQLEGLLRWADGDTAGAVSRLKDAAAAEERLSAGYGPPVPVKPSHELLGELLLVQGQHSEAIDWFERSLARTPGRTASLVGLVEAARLADPQDMTFADRARRASRKLADNLEDRQPFRAWMELPRR